MGGRRKWRKGGMGGRRNIEWKTRRYRMVNIEECKDKETRKGKIMRRGRVNIDVCKDIYI